MTIAAVSAQYGLTPDTLRYYERVGLIPPVPRTAGGIRDYGEDDCRWIEFIKCMRLAGLPVEVLSDYVRLCRLGDNTLSQRKTLLKEQRQSLIQRIADMQETLRRLDGKIERYDQISLPPHDEPNP
ncbi:MAG: MerR family transcriptional regulator [Firmicutes bacterium]|nr:MerR family transcriptional regulator [Bacillota bacterium]